MNTRITSSVLAFALTALVVVPAISSAQNVAVSVNASTTVSAKVQAKLGAKIQNAISRGDKEISRRIDGLNQLATRVQGMVNVSAQLKASIASSIQTQITSLTNLKTKIDADTDATVLKTDIKSIVDSYRIFALVIPQGHLLSAADRVNTIVGTITDLSAKLQVKISAGQSAGKDVSALQSALTDMNAKAADAKTQSINIQTAVSSLTPDLGDQTKFDANKNALVSARADLKTATADLKAARQDIETIVKGLKSIGVEVSASSSAEVHSSATGTEER